jgi:hypothetical protein
MLYDALLVAAISRNLGRENAPSEVYRGELSSVPDLLWGGRNELPGGPGVPGESGHGFIRTQYFRDRPAGLARSSANAKRQRSTRS